jgi:hypothetical protein
MYTSCRLSSQTAHNRERGVRDIYMNSHRDNIKASVWATPFGRFDSFQEETSMNIPPPLQLRKRHGDAAVGCLH